MKELERVYLGIHRRAGQLERRLENLLVALEIEGGSLREDAESERPDPAKVARVARDLKELELAARAAREELGSEDS